MLVSDMLTLVGMIWAPRPGEQVARVWESPSRGGAKLDSAASGGPCGQHVSSPKGHPFLITIIK